MLLQSAAALRFSVTLRLQRLAGASRRRNTALRCCAASLRCGVALRCVVALGNGVALRTRVCCAAALRCCMAPLIRSWCCGVLFAAALGSVFLQPSCGGRASLRRCSKRRWVGADDLQDEGHHGERRVSSGPGANSAYLGTSLSNELIGLVARFANRCLNRANRLV